MSKKFIDLFSAVLAAGLLIAVWPVEVGKVGQWISAIPPGYRHAASLCQKGFIVAGLTIEAAVIWWHVKNAAAETAHKAVAISFASAAVLGLGAIVMSILSGEKYA